MKFIEILLPFIMLGFRASAQTTSNKHLIKVIATALLFLAVNIVCQAQVLSPESIAGNSSFCCSEGAGSKPDYTPSWRTRVACAS